VQAQPAQKHIDPANQRVYGAVDCYYQIHPMRCHMAPATGRCAATWVRLSLQKDGPVIPKGFTGRLLSITKYPRALPRARRGSLPLPHGSGHRPVRCHMGAGAPCKKMPRKPKDLRGRCVL